MPAAQLDFLYGTGTKGTGTKGTGTKGTGVGGTYSTYGIFDIIRPQNVRITYIHSPLFARAKVDVTNVSVGLFQCSVIDTDAKG